MSKIMEKKTAYASKREISAIDSDNWDLVLGDWYSSIESMEEREREREMCLCLFMQTDLILSFCPTSRTKGDSCTCQRTRRLEWLAWCDGGRVAPRTHVTSQIQWILNLGFDAWTNGPHSPCTACNAPRVVFFVLIKVVHQFQKSRGYYFFFFILITVQFLH